MLNHHSLPSSCRFAARRGIFTAPLHFQGAVQSSDKTSACFMTKSTAAGALSGGYLWLARIWRTLTIMAARKEPFVQVFGHLLINRPSPMKNVRCQVPFEVMQRRKRSYGAIG